MTRPFGDGDLGDQLFGALRSRLQSTGQWRDEFEERVQELTTFMAARAGALLVVDAEAAPGADELAELDGLIKARVAQLEAAGVTKAGRVAQAALNDVFGFVLRTLFALL